MTQKRHRLLFCTSAYLSRKGVPNMEFLTPILICAAFIFAAYGLMRLSLFLSNTAARRKILSYGRASEDAVSALLASHFGVTYVLSNRYLPYRTKNGISFTEVDCIVILKGKIAVIEVKSLVGSIYNPPSDTWHQSAKMRDGETKELDFFNPIRQNERHIAALVGILEKAKITPKPKIENLVIFTSARAVFTYERQKEIYTLPEAIKKLKAMNTGRKFRFRDRIKILHTIRKYAKSKRQAMAITGRKRRR